MAAITSHAPNGGGGDMGEKQVCKHITSVGVSLAWGSVQCLFTITHFCFFHVLDLD